MYKSGYSIAPCANLDGQGRYTEPVFKFALFKFVIAPIIILIVTYVFTIKIVIVNPSDCRYK